MHVTTAATQTKHQHNLCVAVRCSALHCVVCGDLFESLGFFTCLIGSCVGWFGSLVLLCCAVFLVTWLVGLFGCLRSILTLSYFCRPFISRIGPQFPPPFISIFAVPLFHTSPLSSSLSSSSLSLSLSLKYTRNKRLILEHPAAFFFLNNTFAHAEYDQTSLKIGFHTLYKLLDPLTMTYFSVSIHRERSCSSA